eukprot:m.179930 g.179930  ORF g.179930 m.179930 type:complete len:153 (+) comp14940_c0_seq1:445-903(+)
MVSHMDKHVDAPSIEVVYDSLQVSRMTQQQFKRCSTQSRDVRTRKSHQASKMGAIQRRTFRQVRPAAQHQVNTNRLQIPKGTYKITKTLQMCTGLGSHVIGTGATSVLQWAGALNGTMLHDRQLPAIALAFRGKLVGRQQHENISRAAGGRR